MTPYSRFSFGLKVNNTFSAVFFLLLCLCLASCGSGPTEKPQTQPSSPKVRGKVQTVNNQRVYIVQRGDTLSAIARRFGTTTQTLARLNGISNPNRVEVGQKIILPGSYAAPSYSSKTYAPTKVKPVNIRFQWPASGSMIRGYDARNGSKGIDIAGKKGDPVYAAGDGKVVYAGSGLRGYGNLIIIKHDEVYLTAYAHNDKILVREGEMVRKGQRIAEMGSTDTDQVKLHFEVRQNGQPVNPLLYLPKR
jgi:murein DD-endopeptidase MepM/ murein hydrolase activator NlpD